LIAWSHEDLQHHIFYLTFAGKLGLSPPNDKDTKVGRVLDLGTGTGIWAMDYGDEHPESEVSPLAASHWEVPSTANIAKVIGIDLSPKLDHENPRIEHAIPRQHTSRLRSHLYGLQGD